MHAHADAPRAAAPLKLLLALGLAAALILPIDHPRAQEARQMSALERGAAPSAGNKALADLGLDLATIEASEDVARLWRAVRELVLPGRVAEATQQRILRRVWAIDADTRFGSVVESTMN